MDATPGRKKQRTRKAVSTSDKRMTRCLLGSLPLELLDDILSRTTLRDILAVARTNKYFCATLLDPAHVRIWKHARLSFVPKIPEPTPNFTEPAYAAFLFDHGVCEECGEKVKTMYASFSLRLRLCDKESCRSHWKKSKTTNILYTDAMGDRARYSSIMSWIPMLEFSDLGFRQAGRGLPGEYSLIRKTDLLAAINEYNKASLDATEKQKYDQEKTALASCKDTWLKLCRNLTNWRNLCSEKAQMNQHTNHSFAKQVSIREGWTLWDMLQSQAFGTLYRNRNVSWEPLKPSDIESIRARLEQELLDMQETAKRRKDEQGYSKRRKDVETFYHELKNDGDGGVMPPLPQFRKLPTVQRMQYRIGQEPNKGIIKELNDSSLFRELVIEDLARWRAKAKAALGALLGVKTWKSASKNKLHPIDRLTARFRCKVCDAKQGDKRWDNPGFGFSGACGHICTRENGKLSKGDWAADRFVPDTTAINVVRQVLQQCGCDDDDDKSVQLVEGLESRIICKSCPGPLRMDFRTLLRHCYRHEDTIIQVLSPEQTTPMVPIEYGLYARLLTKASEPERQRRIYQCRHCVAAVQNPIEESNQSRADTVHAGSAHNGDVEHVEHVADAAMVGRDTTPQTSTTKSGVWKQQSRAFTFDGLRSHAKEKHGIKWVGDEDLYRQPDSGAAAASGPA